MRKLYKDAFLKKHNIKLGFMSAFVKAAAYALTDQPAVNAGKCLHTHTLQIKPRCGYVVVCSRLKNMFYRLPFSRPLLSFLLNLIGLAYIDIHV